MLVIAGAPSRAAAAPCRDCPPDCAMAIQAGAAMHADMGMAGQPAKKAPESPCKPGMPCQTAAAAVVLSDVGAFSPLVAEPAILARLEQAPVPSRPPDPGLRPPIQL